MIVGVTPKNVIGVAINPGKRAALQSNQVKQINGV
jgi:hypothetical protein